MEKALEQISTAGVQCFPAIIGSKPTINGVFKGKENTTPSRCMPSVSVYKFSATSVKVVDDFNR